MDPMRRIIFAATAALLAHASPLLAQEHGGEESGGLLSLNPGLSVWTLIIFLIVLAVLYRAAYPKILAAVEAREAHVRELTESAERDRAEAAALVEEHRKLVEDTRAQVQKALGEATGTAEARRAEILQQAQRERDEMLARARADVGAERASMLEQVRRDSVDLAIRAAERLVRKNLDGDDNRRLVQDYLAQLGGTPAARA
ncbi:MAG TPA: F0F1 ATP synthase subunit B [Longimicrobium sp.]|nr:F0F1 ATP synthase subunit B [Longimicrobium sp.]